MSSAVTRDIFVRQNIQSRKDWLFHRKHTCKNGISRAFWMGGYLENRVEGLKKMSLIGGVIAKREVDHGEVNWLELSSLCTHKKFTNYGVGSVTSNDNVTSLCGSIVKICSDSPLETQA